jgi:hypothetical protein
VLHRAVFAAWLQQLHVGRRDAANLAGNLERVRVSRISESSAFRPAAHGLRQLRTALESVNNVAHESNAPRAAAHRPAVISAIIPCLNEETPIAKVVTPVFAQGVNEVIVVDGGSQDKTADRAANAGARVIVEPQRGYGRAIQAGIAAVRDDAEILVFLDGDGSDPVEFVLSWYRRLLRGKPSSFSVRAFAVHVKAAA